jgi:hypothetical protein
VDDEEGSAGSVTFEVYADASKVYDSGLMTNASATQLVDVSIAGATQLRLVVTDGGDHIHSDHADWAEARIECGGGADTTPPTIIARTPAPGATGVALDVSPSATFSEAMDPATLTTSTFTLQKQGVPTPVAATVSYASATATLDPSANLDPSSTYTATVKGGASGAKDTAGNPLAADVSWSFTTGAGGGGAPTAVIDSPPSTLTWKVGDSISFSGHATDPEQGTLPASALTWTLVVQHCWQYEPANCHSHTIQSWQGVASGSFGAPDHEYLAYLELTLTATDSGGLTDTETLRLDPRTVVLTFQTSPPGLQLAVGSSSSTATFTRTVILGSNNSVSAPSPQTLGGTVYAFVSWSDGGAAAHNIVANAAATYTATFQTAADTQPPTAPTNLTATATSSSQIALSWTAATDNVGVTQYLVERCEGQNCTNFVQIATTAATTYNDTGLNARTRYRYRIRAVDAANNFGPYSNIASARTKN